MRSLIRCSRNIKWRICFRKQFVPQDVKHRFITGCSSPTGKRVPKRSENRGPQENLHMNVHISIVYKGPKVETTQCPSTAEGIQKIQYTLQWNIQCKKCWCILPRGRALKNTMPSKRIQSKKDRMFYDSTCTKFPEEENVQRQKVC